jgi:hypothetical protein
LEYGSDVFYRIGELRALPLGEFFVEDWRGCFWNGWFGGIYKVVGFFVVGGYTFL